MTKNNFAGVSVIFLKLLKLFGIRKTVFIFITFPERYLPQFTSNNQKQPLLWIKEAELHFCVCQILWVLGSGDLASNLSFPLTSDITKVNIIPPELWFALLWNHNNFTIQLTELFQISKRETRLTSLMFHIKCLLPFCQSSLRSSKALHLFSVPLFI